MGRQSQHDFLDAAGVWMACRWGVMGHLIDGMPVHWHGDLDMYLLGMHDHVHEMHLICEGANKE